MDFDQTCTEVELDQAALDFARMLRERPLHLPRDMTVDGFRESLGSRLLRLFRSKKDDL
jgi:hypothetical protein